MKRAFGIAMLLASLAGCRAGRPLIAPSADLADYRSFRVAAAEGTRLARAQRYLERHPRGVFADEVRAIFEREEPAFFAKAQGSRQAARDYLVDLPDGPHASSALALLGALATSVEDAELRDIALRVRHEDARFEVAAEQRRQVGEAILGAVGALLDDGVYGEKRERLPEALRRQLEGPSPTTWGATPARREHDLFFSLPTRPERESRLLTLELSVVDHGEGVEEGRLEGRRMFVAWTEADRIVKLDEGTSADRQEAFAHAMERLTGALERRFPEGACEDRRKGDELFHRACNGWEATVSAGPGGSDSVVVRGPTRAKTVAP